MLSDLIHPGQHDVNIGRTPFSLIRLTNSFPSSMIVRSAAKLVSKTASNLVFQSSVHFPCDQCPDWKSQLFSKGYSNGRGFLNNYIFIRISDSSPDIVDRTFFPL